MPKEQVPLTTINDYLPDHTSGEVIFYLKQYNIQLTITRKRKTVLGDYRHHPTEKKHKISVNGNLNRYSFLITFLHELAHLLTFDKYGTRVSPHGSEWKKCYAELLEQFLFKKVFPSDIEQALRKSLNSPAASTCGEPELMRVLRKYDAGKEGTTLVETLEEGAFFSIEGGRIFKRGPKIRTRYKCMEMDTGKIYLFNGLYEVKSIQ